MEIRNVTITRTKARIFGRYSASCYFNGETYPLVGLGNTRRAAVSDLGYRVRDKFVKTVNHDYLLYAEQFKTGVRKDG